MKYVLLVIAVFLVGCGPSDHRSYTERLLAQKEACDKLGGKFNHEAWVKCVLPKE